MIHKLDNSIIVMLFKELKINHYRQEAQLNLNACMTSLYRSMLHVVNTELNFLSIGIDG